MKVGFITSEYPPDNPGGAGISSKLIVESLRKRNINVEVFALTNNKRMRNHTNNVHHLPSPSNYPGPNVIGENISVLRHLPPLEKFDILHVYNVRHIPAVMLRHSQPVVATMNNHAWISPDPKQHLREGLPKYNLWKTLQHSRTKGYSGFQSVGRTGIEYAGKTLVQKADHYTVQTKGMKTVMKRSGYDPEQISIIPNILDERFKINSETKENRIIFVGQLQNHKGPLMLAQAFDNLPENTKKGWKFDIYGKGNLRTELEDYISDNNLNRLEIKYSDYQNLPKIYAKAELLVHPSKYTEPFSRTWLEAMASGTALLCSKNPSSIHVLKDIAKFFNPFDQDSLITSLSQVMRDSQMRDEMAEAGKQAVEQYTEDVVGNRYIDVYHGVLNGQFN